MERGNHIVRFFGGINTDTHKKDLPQGDYIYALNARNTKTNNGNFGGITNVKGNLLIDYNLPQGDNIVIGTKEDAQSSTCIYMIWNSNKEHLILRYHSKTDLIELLAQGEYLGFKKDWLINQSSIIDSKILQYTDAVEDKEKGLVGNPMRYIDIQRISLLDKKLKFSVIVGSAFYNKKTTQYVVVIKDKNNNEVANEIIINPIQSSIENDKSNLYERIVTAINNNSVLNNLLVADDCGGCKIDIEFKETGYYWIDILSDDEIFITLPQNYYHKDLDSISITLGKRPPMCSPKINLKIDKEIGYNYINNRYFQFAYRYVYWDSQKSTLSPFSEIGNKPIKCGTTESPFNCIEVDFTDDILNTPKYLSDIKYIEILAREGNTGSFKSVKKIEPCDLDFPTQKFCFKNEGSYSVITDEEAYIPYQYMPLLSLAHNVIDDRGYWGNTLEDYNNIDCVDAKINVEYEDFDDCSKAKEYVTIKGKLRIINHTKIGPGGGSIIDNDVWRFQPIWSKNGTDFYFGGTGNKKLNNEEPDETEMANSMQQIPLGGFTVYLAGTPYYAITKQRAEVPIVAGSETNVYNFSEHDNFKTYIEKARDRKTYSEFEIKNVPKGAKYILRVASHLLAEDDRYGSIHNIKNGIAWQRTSTTLTKMNGQFVTEIEIDTNITGDTIEISDYLEIEDMSAEGVEKFNGVAGYVIDGITNHNGDIADLQAGIAMEQCDLDSMFITNSVQSPNKKTDHNGFFFGGNDVLSIYIPSIKLDNKNVYIDSQGTYVGLLGDLESGTLSIANSITYKNNGVRYHVVYNNNKQISDCYRTFIQGTITDQYGDGLQNIKVVSTNTNRIGITDKFGVFKIAVYKFRVAPSDRTGKIFYYSEDDCCPDFEVNSINYAIPTIQCSGNYSPSVPYEINQTIVGIVNTPPTGVWKHRNNVKLGIKYYDMYGRSTKVQTSDSLNTYIPFWTEENGVKGLPQVSWEINHQAPPQATHYQIVRIINPIYSRYLQFFVSDVKYITYNNFEINETSYDAGEATEIYISLQPLVDYLGENSGSVLTWEFQVEDRITLMRDANGDWYENFYDLRVENDRVITLQDSTYLVVKNNSQLPKIEAGVMIEVYSPKSITTEDVFYEITECYPIINGLHGAGYNGQNQTLLQPATGIIKYGDASFVSRKMPIIQYNDAVEPNPPTIDKRELKTGLFETEYMDERNALSKVFHIGRIDVENADFSQKHYFNRIRFTGRYIPNTNINELNRFQVSDYIKDNLESEIDRVFGGVMYLAYVGNLLMAINKFKCVPIYINSTQVFDLNNNETLTRSSRIANLGLPIKEDRGTQNPESVTVQNGEVYAYDLDKSVVWRYSYAGLFDISDYDVINEFKQISKILKSLYENARILSVYDRNNEECLFTFPQLERTISFNNVLRGEVRKNRWNTEYAFIPEKYGIVSNQLLSFKNGSLYKHESNEVRGEFYGVKYPMKVHVVINNIPDTKKQFWTLRQKSTDKFITEDSGIITYLNDKETQYSQLKEYHFTQEEGDWYADFLRDITDKNFLDIEDEETRKVTALLKGSVLTGDYCVIKFFNNEEKEVILYSIDVETSVSMRTK